MSASKLVSGVARMMSMGTIGGKAWRVLRSGRLVWSRRLAGVLGVDKVGPAEVVSLVVTVG
ncbi:hypothetical protein [Candidatus Poriferisocius sp.]|uniref:hypothetical protein n=1 Tax=Candidatus Poriferisocius sp. TaxID=3101276 RepID=UPI003B5CE933